MKRGNPNGKVLPLARKNDLLPIRRKVSAECHARPLSWKYASAGSPFRVVYQDCASSKASKDGQLQNEIHARKMRNGDLVAAAKNKLPSFNGISCIIQ